MPVLPLSTLVFVVVALGCGARQAPPVLTAPEPAAPAGAFRPAGHYAPLFEEGRRWRYRVTSQSTLWDDQDPAADAGGNVTTRSEREVACAVQEVRVFASALASEVVCDERLEGIDGVYGATAEGLLRLSALPGAEADLAGLRQGEALIAAAPVEEHHRVDHDEGDSGRFGEERSLSLSGPGAFCTSHSSWGGDESSETTCFAEGRGIESVNREWSGGSVQTTVIELIE